MHARAAVGNCQDSLKVGLSGLVDWGQSILQKMLKEAPIRSIPGGGAESLNSAGFLLAFTCLLFFVKRMSLREEGGTSSA